MRISSLPFCFFLPPSPSVWHRRKGDGGESVACVCVVLKVLQFEGSLQLRHCILVAPVPSLCKSPILPFILNTEAHTSMHARIHLQESDTNDSTAQWPSFHVAQKDQAWLPQNCYGHKKPGSEHSVRPVHMGEQPSYPSHFYAERSLLQPQPAVQSRNAEIAIAFLAKSPDRRNCKRDGRQEDLQVKLCAVFSLE